MSEDSPLYQEWLKKVEEDEFAGKEILDGKQFHAPACFHFQQVAEKSLKALLIFYGKEFPRIHDLIALASLIEPISPDIKNYKSDLEFLNRYYIETRYPGDYSEFTLEETQKALGSALNVKNFTLEKIKNPIKKRAEDINFPTGS